MIRAPRPILGILNQRIYTQRISSRIIQTTGTNIPEKDPRPKIISKPKEYALNVYLDMKNKYDNLTGATKIEDAQAAVHETETALTEIQSKQLPLKTELRRIKEQIHELNIQQQGTTRRDAYYLNIMKQLVDLNEEETRVQEQYEIIEEKTRILFEEYKSAVRKSYEVERTRNTQFNGLSIILSTVCGGITFLILLLKFLTQSTEFREIQRLVSDSEKQRQVDIEWLQANMLEFKQLMLDQNRSIAKIDQQTQPNRSVGKAAQGYGNSVYNWVSWAVGSLKFW